MMTSKKLEKACSIILRHFQPQSQVIKTIEEMAELTKELCKSGINNIGDGLSLDTGHELREEIADCIVMLMQMRELFGKEEVDIMVENKIRRTLDRMGHASYD